MPSPAQGALAMLLAAACWAAAMPLPAAQACAGFSWDVSRERELFARPPLALKSGVDTASAPLLSPERLYLLQLQPIGEVTFLTTPGRKPPAMSAYAGLAALRISTPGTYRIAVDAPVWIDVVADGGIMGAKGFQGASDCNAPHKIVEFEFPVAREVTLQFSGASGTSIRVSIAASDSR